MGLALLVAVVAPVSAATAQQEETQVLRFEPGVTATVVRPQGLAPGQSVDLILYALPNGNTTAQTIGARMVPGLDWHFDIQHIGAQTRWLRQQGMRDAIVVYLEAEGRSWPAWRAKHGYDSANARIVQIVDSLRHLREVWAYTRLVLTGHSGGGSFTFGFLDGVETIPDWVGRIAFLDSNYGFEARHAGKFAAWLRRSPQNRLIAIAYDDREIMLDGKKVVSDSGGTWRATHRMLDALGGRYLQMSADTTGDFLRYQSPGTEAFPPQVVLLLHPNPQNRILHTELVGEMNGFIHAMLLGRAGYGAAASVLGPPRRYMDFVEAAKPD